MELLVVGWGLLYFALVALFYSREENYTTGKIISAATFILGLVCIIWYWNSFA